MVDGQPAVLDVVAAQPGGPCGSWEPDGLVLAVHQFVAGSQTTSSRLALFDHAGNQVGLPDAAFPDSRRWPGAQELDARLAPDGTEVALRYRCDACRPMDPVTGVVDPEQWALDTLAVPAELRVVELASGAVRYATRAPAGTQLVDFDGRFLVLADVGVRGERAERSARTTVVDTSGRWPPWSVTGGVRLLRPVPGLGAPDLDGGLGPGRALRARGAEVDVDGVAGPATEAAWAAFARAQGLVDGACPGGWLTPGMAEALGFPPGDTVVGALAAQG